MREKLYISVYKHGNIDEFWLCERNLELNADAGSQKFSNANNGS
jgi:hypothetical protein